MSIINEIQKRHDKQAAYERGDAGLPDVNWDDMFYKAHADRKTLLDIIRDISEALSEDNKVEWCDGDYQRGFVHGWNGKTDELQAIINRAEK